MDNPRVLIVEDDAISVASLRQIVEQMGYVVAGIAASGRDAISLSGSEKPDVVLMDIRLRGKMTGIDAAEKIRSQSDVPIIYLTAYSEDNLLNEASVTQPYGFLVKPVRDRELRASIETALYKAEADRQLKHLNQMLRSVRNVNQLITREKDRQRLLDEACQILYRVHGYLLVWIGLVDDTGKKVEPVAWIGEGKEYLELISKSSRKSPGKFPCQEAIRQLEAVVVQDLTTDPRFGQKQKEIQAFGFQSSVSVPILHDEQLFGVLCVLSSRINAFLPEEIDLLQELASDLGFAMHNIEVEADRNRVVEELGDREARLSAIFRAAPIGIGLVSKRILLEVNDRICVMAGYTREELVGQNARFLYPTDEDYEFVGKAKYDQIAEWGAGSVETRWKRKNGQIIDILLGSTPIEPTDLDRGVTFTALDITERKLAEEAQRLSEEHFSTVFKASPIGISITRIEDGKVIDANPAFLKMFGFTREEAIGHTTQELKVWADPDERSRLVGVMREQSRIYDYETKGRQKTGEIFDILVSAEIIELAGEPHMLSLMQDVSERKRADRSLRESEQRFRMLVENAPLGYQLLDEDGNFIYVNQAWLDLTGYQRQEVLGRWFGDFLAPSCLENFKKSFSHFKSEGETHNELTILRKNNSPVIVDIHGNIGYDEKEKFIQAHCILTDITERRHAEEALEASEARYRSLVEQAGAGIAHIDVEGRLSFVNETLCKITGYSHEDVWNKPFSDFLHPDDINKMIQLFQEAAQAVGREINLECRIIHRLGYPISISASPAPILIKDDLTGFGVVIQDISERKQADEMLRESEERFRQIVDNAVAGYFRLDEQGRYVQVNNAWLEIHGYDSADEVVGQSYTLTQVDEDLEEATGLGQQVLSGDALTGEFSRRNKDGSIGYHNFSSRPIFAKGELVGVEGFLIDATERRKAVEALGESEARYRLLAEHMRDVVWLMDLQENRFLYVSPSVYQLVGYTPEEVMAQPVIGALTLRSQEDFANWISTELQLVNEGKGEQRPKAYLIEQPRKDGSTVWIEVVTDFIYDEHGNPYQVVGLARDITERAQAEEALRSSEKRFRALIENSSEAILLLSPELEIIYDSTTSGRILGYKDEIIVGQNLADWIHPQDMPKLADVLAHSLSEPSKEFRTECRVRNKEGAWVWMEGSLTNLLVEPSIRALVVNYHDFSERKLATDALRESEERFRRLAENAQDLIYRYDTTPIPRFTYVSPAATSVTGYTPEDYYTDPQLAAKLVHPEDLNLLIQYFLGEGVYQIPLILRWIRKDGLLIYIEHRIVPIYDDKGDLVALEGVARDITGRKLAEEMLQESEEKYRTLVERANDGIVIIQDSIVRFANSRMAEMWGGSTDEIVDRPISDFIHPDELPLLALRYQQRLAGEEVLTIYDTRLLRKDGSSIPTNLNAGVIDYLGRPADMVLVRDITQRVQSEQALHESEERYRSLFNGVQVGLFRTTPDGRLLEFNPSLVKMLGYPDRQTLLETNVSDLYVNPGDRRDKLERIEKAQDSLEFETRLRKYDGQIIWTRDVMQAVRDYSGNIIYFEGNVEDISERVLAEKALRESEEKYRNLVERANDGIAIIQGSIIRFVNQRMADMFHGSVEEIIGRSIADFIHPNELPNIVDRYLQRMSGDPLTNTYETVFLRKDGSPLPVELNAGIINYMDQPADLVLVRDISNRKKDEQALRESEERYRSLFQGVPVGLYRTTVDGRILEANPCLIRMLGYPDRQTLMDANVTDIYVEPEERPLYLDKTEGSQGSRQAEAQLRRYDGQIIWVRDLMQAVKDDSGLVQYYQGSLEDITERKQVEEALKRRNQELSMLYETAMAVSSHLSLDAVLRTVTRQMVQAFDISGCALSLWNREMNRIEILIDQNVDSTKDTEMIGAVYDLANYPMTQKVLETGESVIIQRNDSDADEAEIDLLKQEDVQSLLMLPLIIGDQAIGLVEVFDELKIRDFTQEEIRLAQGMASQAAVAIENARLYEQAQQEIAERKQAEEALERSNRELSMLNKTATAISSHLSLDTVLQTVAEQLARAMDSSGCTLSIWNKGTNVVETLLDFSLSSLAPIATHGEIYNLADFPSTRRVLESGEPMVIHSDDPTADKSEIKLMEKWNGRTLFLLPMIVGDRTTGLIEIHDKLNSRDYTPEEIRLARSMASQAAVAIENTRLYEQAQQEIAERKRAEEQIIRRADEFASLYETARNLAEQTNLHTILQTIVRRASSLLGGMSSMIYLFDPKRNDLYVVATSNPLVPVGVRLALGEGLAGRVANSCKPMIIKDYYTWEGRSIQYEDIHFTSVVQAPMTYQGELIGVLSVDNYLQGDYVPTEREFDDKDINLLSMFASQAASAVYNTRLLNATRQRLAELELLYEGGLSFNQLLQPEQIGEKIIEVIQEKIAWHHAALRLYNPQNDTLKLLAFSQPEIENEKVRQAVQARFEAKVSKIDQGLSGWAIQCEKTIRCADVTQDEHYVETHPNIRSGLYVPLMIGKRILGVISVESEEINAFSETDERLLATLMSQAAIALDNARLLVDARRRLQRNIALREIDIVISSSLDLKLTFKAILERAIEQLEVDAADILLLDQDTAVLEYAAGNGFHTSTLQHTRLPLGEGYAGIAALEKRTIYIPQLKNRKTDFLRSPHFSAESFVDYYAVPLIAKGRVRGVLEVFNRTPLFAEQEWLDFLETLAGQTAIAIDSITLFNELQRSNAELSIAYDATIEGWSRALDLRDKETEGHTQRVTEMTMRLAREMGIEDEGLLHVQRGALLHDIGKMGVPDNILNKPGSLTDEEKKIMYEHPVFAHRMLSPIVYLRLALDIPYCHHEKWDGTGYPRQLMGEHIPLAARIFAVVDVYDALISDRPYRLAWSKERAIEHIKEQSGKYFDPAVVKAFLSTFAR